jgi:aspartate racemase
MKTIGIIGGMSWESTTLYYQIINREIAARLGGLNSAPLVLQSLNFEEIATRQKAQDWAGMAGILSKAARNLQMAGAECILIGTNTMHRIAPEVQGAVEIPLLHIGDVTSKAVIRAGLSKVGLLGTRFTMEQPFYQERLATYGIECVTPSEDERVEVHRIIFEELCKGELKDSSRRALLEIIQTLHKAGAEGIILGCTELPLIIQKHHTDIPTFDTTELHALAAVEFCLQAEMTKPPRAVPAFG